MVDIASKNSFRDPSGFIFYEDGQIFRKINPVYLEIYRTLKEEKVFETLQQEELLIEHREREREREREFRRDRNPTEDNSFHFLPLRMVFRAVTGCGASHIDTAKTSA